MSGEILLHEITIATLVNKTRNYKPTATHMEIVNFLVLIYSTVICVLTKCVEYNAQ